MYKISKYNFYIPIEEYNIYLIYNSISNGLYEIEFGKGKKLSEIINISKDEFEKIFNNKERNFLFKGQIIIDDAEDEWEKLTKRLIPIENYKKKSGINFTLLPTYECNLACPYCFEKSKPKGKMSLKVMDQIISLINQIREKEPIINDHIAVTWYGGEPLLYPDVIKTFSEKILRYTKESDLRYLSNIITNGVRLDEVGWKTLVDAKTTQVQITIDGSKTAHNKSRPSKDGTDSYSKILDNLKNIPEGIPRVVIRINGNKSNTDSLEDFLEDLKEKELWPQKRDVIKLSFAYMRPYKSKSSASQDSFFDVLESNIEGRRFKQLMKKMLSETYNREIKDGFEYPAPSPMICTTTHNPYGLVIDPFGRIYKCWEDVGKEYRQLGSIFEEYETLRRKLYDNPTINFNRLTDVNECTDCKFLPICSTCPVRFLDKENYMFCTNWKYELEELFTEQYKIIRENPERIRFKIPTESELEKEIQHESSSC